MGSAVRAAVVIALLASACSTSYTLASYDSGIASDAGSSDAAVSTNDASDDANSEVADAPSIDDGVVVIDGSSADASANGFPVALGARLRLWLDANDASTVKTTNIGGNAVTTWTDRSPSALVATTGGGTVTYVPAKGSVTGSFALTSNGYLSIPNSAALSFVGEAFSVYVVASYAAADMGTTDNNLVSSLNGAGGYALSINGTAKVCGYVGMVSTCGTAAAGTGIFALKLGPSSLVASEIGKTASASQAATAAADTEPLLIGADTPPAHLFFKGSIDEIIVVDAPTATEATAIENYLTTKYAGSF